MILEEATFKAYGRYPSSLSYGSNRVILVACDKCRKIRSVTKRNYHPLCRTCVMKGKPRTEEIKAKISKATKGKKNPNWQGGISFEPYCFKFNVEYKEYIRAFFGNECFLCGLSEPNNGRALSVHHVNHNKNCSCDDTVCICIPFCDSCHAKTNYDRDYWQALIMEMLKPMEAWNS